MACKFYVRPICAPIITLKFFIINSCKIRKTVTRSSKKNTDYKRARHTNISKSQVTAPRKNKKMSIFNPNDLPHRYRIPAMQNVNIV